MKSAIRKDTEKKPAKRVIEKGTNLSRAEMEILHLIAKEMTTREIAEFLELSPKTVENHRSNICKRLGITGTSALLKYTLKMK